MNKRERKMIFFTLMSARADGRKQGQACRTQLLNYFQTALPHRVVCMSARERERRERERDVKESVRVQDCV